MDEKLFSTTMSALMSRMESQTEATRGVMIHIEALTQEIKEYRATTARTLSANSDKIAIAITRIADAFEKAPAIRAVIQNGGLIVPGGSTGYGPSGN